MNLLHDKIVIALINGGITIFISALLILLIAKFAERYSPTIARKINFVGLLLIAPTFLFAYWLSSVNYPHQPVFNLKISPQSKFPAQKHLAQKTNQFSPHSTTTVNQSRPTETTNSKPTTQLPAPIPVGQFVLISWAITVAFLVIRREIGKRLLQVQLQNAKPFPLHTEALTPEEQNHIAIVNSPLAIPFVCHLKKTYLALPPQINELSLEERQAVILHELSHIRNGHIAQSEIETFIKSLFIGIPTVYFLAQNLKNLQETEADTDVINQLGEGKALARAISIFSSHDCRGITSAAHRLVISGRPLQKRVLRLMKQKRTTMRIPKITKVALGIACSAVAIGSPFVVQLNSSKAVLNQPSAKLVNWKIGHAWQYEMKFSDGTVSKYVLNAISEIPVKDGVVVEYQKHATSYNNTPIISYEYQTITPQGVFPTANSEVSNANPGFGDRVQVQLIPADARTKSWSANEGQGVNTGGNGKYAIQTTAKILSVNQPITLPNGKFRATVIETTEKADWDITIRTRWYVENIGKVREVLSRPNGLILMEENLIGFEKVSKPRQIQYIDSVPMPKATIPPTK